MGAAPFRGLPCCCAGDLYFREGEEISQYSLEVQFDAAGLKSLGDSGQSVAIVQRFALFPSPFAVVWLALPPEETIKIAWPQSVEVFASSTPVVAGSSVEVTASLPASLGHLYQFLGGQFSELSTKLSGNQIGIENNDSRFPHLTVGLARSESGAESAAALPLNLAAVLPGERALFELEPRLSIFAGTVRSGAILPKDWCDGSGDSAVVLGPVLTFDASAETVVHFASDSSSFELGPLPC